MKLNSISGVTYKVRDLDKSAAFYESIGMRIGKRDDNHVTCYVNWFWVDLVADDTAGDKGVGASLHIKVDSIEECHKDLVAQGMKPEGEPETQPSGDRTFALRDPDGYQLVFFEKK
ncbi:MAG TPA: VOC family protein [Candidatus Saccharimonadales bacterium]|nr:VOC family protein [Candidatus Saccharimonadales bacterium]